MASNWRIVSPLFIQHHHGMLAVLIPMIVTAIPCALVTLATGLALNRWASGWNRSIRMILSAAASIVPSIVAMAFATEGNLVDLVSILLSMTSNEFLTPFGIQTLITICFAGPIAWLTSRRRANDRDASALFE